ncbi:carbohydrate porin [Aliifodinibius sp. S!AR15-10]|uniref:carbohydrate porin n=1 Tax=Aliifodinibius sp. S!AR15-10 TaxID=2950437 RepID=UPI00285F9ACE|nr:carbohydrate porin [Aliifodinibius sp. S!AR15-10]MDR8394595.1 carbohydrate porin [Aliifodinibius sp. S!AR15-10]
MDTKAICSILFTIALSIPVAETYAQDDEEQTFMEGLDAGITYTADIFSNTTGGNDTGFRYMDNLDLEVMFDTDEGLGWGSTEFYIYGLANQGGSISELAGDIQGISNIESETSWRIYEAWFQKYIYDIRTSILVGLYDLNSEFDVINTATLFVNSSHGIGPEYALSGVLGPSIFPYTSMGVRFKSNPIKGVVIKGALLDGIPSNPQNTDGTKIFFRERDGLLLAGEVAFHPEGEESMIARSRTARIRDFLSRGVGENNRYKAAVGGWMYTKERAGWLSGPQRNNGLYVLGEYRLFEEESDAYQGLSGFARYGVSNEKVNRLSSYVGAGLVYTGLIRGRSRDQLGIALAMPFNSSDYEQEVQQFGLNPTSYEMNIETTYRLQVKNFSFVQLDLQYIVNPGLLEQNENALVVGTRLQFSL